MQSVEAAAGTLSLASLVLVVCCLLAVPSGAWSLAVYGSQTACCSASSHACSGATYSHCYQCLWDTPAFLPLGGCLVIPSAVVNLELTTRAIAQVFTTFSAPRPA